jgi:DNA-directed RNA polymerase specialized sigma24 family protein
MSTKKVAKVLILEKDLEKQSQIARLLHPVAIKTATNIARKYQNGIHSGIFSFEEIMGIAEEIITQISVQVVLHEVDEKGMYSYLTQSVENRTKDLYKAQVKTVKRGSNIKMVNDDVFSVEMEGSLSNSPELILMQKKYIEDGLNFLSNFDTPKVSFSKIVKMYLDGFTVHEIQEVLNMPISTLERNKKKGIEILAKFYKSEGLSFEDLVPYNENLDFLRNDEKKQLNQAVMIIKETSYNKNNVYATLNIIGVQNCNNVYAKEVLDSFTFESECALTLFLSGFTKESEKIYQNIYLDRIKTQKEDLQNAA